MYKGIKAEKKSIEVTILVCCEARMENTPITRAVLLVLIIENKKQNICKKLERSNIRREK
jgi:hypothetical protein